MDQPYPLTRIEGWLPIAGALVKPGDVIMAHPEDTEKYHVSELLPVAWNISRSQALKIQPDQWYYIKAGA